VPPLLGLANIVVELTQGFRPGLTSFAATALRYREAMIFQAYRIPFNIPNLIIHVKLAPGVIAQANAGHPPRKMKHVCPSRTMSKICIFVIESLPAIRYAQAAHTGGSLVIFEIQAAIGF